MPGKAVGCQEIAGFVFDLTLRSRGCLTNKFITEHSQKTRYTFELQLSAEDYFSYLFYKVL